MSPTGTSGLPHEIVWAMTTALAPARALHLVVDLGLADHIYDETVSVTELAVRCGVDPDSLDRVLRLLVSRGIFQSAPDGYRHSEASRLLCENHPMSMRAFVRMFGLPVFWSSFAGLDISARAGAPHGEEGDPAGFWAYLEAHGDEARIFDEAVAANANVRVASLLEAYDFRSFRTVADIGGGRGHLLEGVLDAIPSASGVLFDLPRVIETLEVRSERLTLQAGNFFSDALPGADAYILKEVIHDWADTEAVAILRAVRRAAQPGAVVLIIEGIVPEGYVDPRVHTLDVTMLAITGGRERTAAELDRLLQGSGLRLRSVIAAPPGPTRILEAVAV